MRPDHARTNERVSTANEHSTGGAQGLATASHAAQKTAPGAAGGSGSWAPEIEGGGSLPPVETVPVSVIDLLVHVARDVGGLNDVLSSRCFYIFLFSV